MKKILQLILLSSFIVSTSVAQLNWDAKPKNLKVLPDSISGQDLRKTMIGYAQALGVKCTFCHDDSKGREFSDIDFASDLKPEKDVARQMIKMTRAINNDFIASLKKYSNPVLEVQCVTCHHGYEEPIELPALLLETYKEDGIDSTMKKYDELKDHYYGSFTFDFKENSLDKFGKNLLDLGNDKDALVALKKNAELFPEWPNAYESLGDVYKKLGNKDEAIKNYKKSIEMNPRNQHAKEMLKELEG